MRQVKEGELRFVIKYELGRLRASTFKAMASGHLETRSNALDAAADRIIKRMADWEILMPEPGVNIFAEDPSNPMLGFRFPIKK